MDIASSIANNHPEFDEKLIAKHLERSGAGREGSMIPRKA